MIFKCHVDLHAKKLPQSCTSSTAMCHSATLFPHVVSQLIVPYGITNSLCDPSISSLSVFPSVAHTGLRIPFILLDALDVVGLHPGGIAAHGNLVILKAAEP